MVTEIPSDLLKVLKDVLSESVDEYHIELLKNDKKGEGFIGQMHFVTLVHKRTQKITKLIVKQEKHVNGKTVSFVEIFFRNEIYFYDTIWPAMKEFYKNATGKELDFVAKCYGTSSLSPRRIILENICPKGFVTYDKTQTFDEEHFKIIFETYGIYHAVSLALKVRKNEEYTRLITPLLDTKRIFYADDQFPTKTLIKAMQIAQESVNATEPLAEKLRLYEKSGPELVRESLNNTNFQGVITHGDCWSNNLMFKYDVSRIKVYQFFLPVNVHHNEDFN